MDKRIISTDKAPSAIGPYSQAILCGNTLYASGQIALDPETQEMVAGGIAEQTERVIKNLEAVINEAGGTLKSVVKTTVYLSDMSLFAEMNKVYEKCFGDSKPARATVEVSALPKNGLVEIDAVAVI